MIPRATMDRFAAACLAPGCVCATCGEDQEFSPNIDAFDICGELLCDECSEQVFEDNGQFGVGA